MKKLLLASFVFVAISLAVNAQVRITEASPITSTRSLAKFFELYFYTPQDKTATNSSYYDGYRMVVYTRSSDKERVIIGKMNLTPIVATGSSDIFYKSSQISATPSFTPGVVTIAEVAPNVNTSKVEVEYTWSSIFGNNITEFVRTPNSSEWTTSSNTVDIFPNINTNHKIAVMVFRPSAPGQNDVLVDVVADFEETGNLIKLLPQINSTSYPIAAGINFSNIKIAPEKFVNQALGVDNPYQIEKTTTLQNNVSSCEIKWKKIAKETPGLVLGFTTNTTSWSLKYFIKNSTDAVNEFSIPVTDATSFSSTPSVYEVDNASGGKDIKVRMKLEVYNITNFWDNSIEVFKNHFLTSVYNDIVTYDQLFNTANGKTSEDPILVSKAKLVPPSINITNVVTSSDNSISFNIDFTVTPSTARIAYLTTLDGTNGDNCFSVEKYFAIPSALLPATVGNFNVYSHQNKLTTKWQTLSESNNKGFEVQRSIGNTNDFKTIGFVGTKAKQGNSESEISYSFDDADVKAGQIHYYRLNQIDFDGKSAFSPVKSIKPGSIESNLNVYPNPSQGSITVNTGSNAGKLNIFVMDNTGRVVNQFMNVSTSNTRINNLKKGFYTLKIVNTESGEQSAQRLVVQ